MIPSCFKFVFKASKTRFVALVVCFGLSFVAAIALKLSPLRGMQSLHPPPSESDPAAMATLAMATTPMNLGVNLNGVVDWSSQMPFLDHFKSTTRWIPQCDRRDPACGETWGTGEDDQLDLDPEGWVRSLPSPTDPVRYTKVTKHLFRASPYPAGRYVVLYDGEGMLEYRYGARKDEALSTPGRDVLDVTPSDRGVLITITATDPNHTGNYIRNIRVIQEEYENTYQTQLFNPTFLKRIEKFKVIRFMNWIGTNDSLSREWDKRPVPEMASYSSKEKGVPLEIMVELVNRLNQDPWFTIPHMATNDYITRFAQRVKEQLHPEATIYVEYSNEVWNRQFEQHHWVKAQALREWGEEATYQWYGKRSAEMCDIWKSVFGEAANRVVCVMGTWTNRPEVAREILSCPLWSEAPCSRHGIDALGITGYFGGYLGDPDYVDQVESWLSEPDGGFNKLFTDLQDNSILQAGGLQQTFDKISENLVVAQEYGLDLVAYEGGQHIVGKLGVQDNEAMTNFFIEANRHPEMYTIYTRLLNEWKRRGGGLFVHFSDIRTPDKWGSWGALEHVDQESSPKYDALIDFIDHNS